ncbi:hypothetical protein ACIQ9Q_24800 [Streptomyces sp. NPDC094438]
MHALADPVRLQLPVAFTDDEDHSCTATAEVIAVRLSVHILK